MTLKTALSFVIQRLNGSKLSPERVTGAFCERKIKWKCIGQTEGFASNVSHRYFSRMNGPDAIMWFSSGAVL